MPLTYAEQSRLALLAAVGLEHSDAEAFDLWQASVDLDELPPGHFLLLPLIYDSLKLRNQEHPWLPRIRGVYRKMWYASQVARGSLVSALEGLQAAHHPALVVGAAALAQTVYPKPALRPLLLPEVVVPMQSIDGAIQTLAAFGWRAQTAAPHRTGAGSRTWVGGQRLVNAQQQTLWLGWHVAPNLPCTNLDRTCWAASVDLTLGSVTVRTLCPTDNLLRACLAGQEGSLVALADAALLMRGAGIDWQRLVASARIVRAAWPVLSVLMLLEETVGLKTPPEVLAALRQLPATYAEKQRPLGMAALAHQFTWRRRFWRLLARYQRTAACGGGKPNLRTFVAYLQHIRRLDSPWQIPQDVIRRIAG